MSRIEPQSEVEKVTDEATYVRKGKRVVCEFFRAKPVGSYALAGMMMKTTGSFARVTGVVTDITGEGSRRNPVNIKVHVLVETEEPACSPDPLPGEESLIGTTVMLSPSTVKEVLP